MTDPKDVDQQVEEAAQSLRDLLDNAFYNDLVRRMDELQTTVISAIRRMTNSTEQQVSVSLRQLSEEMSRDASVAKLDLNDRLSMVEAGQDRVKTQLDEFRNETQIALKTLVDDIARVSETHAAAVSSLNKRLDELSFEWKERFNEAASISERSRLATGEVIQTSEHRLTQLVASHFTRLGLAIAAGFSVGYASWLGWVIFHGP